MRLTILGGGGFRVPLVHAALVADGAIGADGGSGATVDTLVLHDTDPARVEAIRAVLDARSSGRLRVVVENDLVAAVTGADFVFSAIRVGGLRGRACDERSALDEGLLGQETTGAGGVLYGLRTIPVAMRIAETVARHARDAWVINFTNPAGMVTEAMAAVLGDRVIGICDSPVGLFRRVARVLNIDQSRAWFDYAGLNHLGWLRRVLVNGRDVLPELLASDDALGSFEEGKLFGPSWLRSLGAIPNEYLYYYYFTRDAISSINDAGRTRGEFLLEQQAIFYHDAAGGSVGEPPRGHGDLADDHGAPGGRHAADAADAPDAAARWDATRLEREVTYLAESREAAGAGSRDEADLEGGGYEHVALDLMRALAGAGGAVGKVGAAGTGDAAGTGRAGTATLVLNVRNRSALPGLDERAVVEVPCVVDVNGAHPLAAGPLDPAAHSLVTTLKEVERRTIAAATSGSRAAAVEALALHPLVDSVSAAERVLDRELAELPELRAVLQQE